MKALSTSKYLSPTASRLLADNTFDIEFRGYLSNHAKHAVIALDRLRAPSARVEEYWNAYTSMTPYNMQLHKVDQSWDDIVPATFDQWKEWRGKKKHWQEQVSFVQNQLINVHNGDEKALIRQLAPDLLMSPSLAGGLTHGIIHLGWGVDAGSPYMITEGLAYLNFCAIGIEPSCIQIDKYMDENPIDSLIRVSKTWHDENLQESWAERTKAVYDDTESFHPELVVSGFQWQVAKLLHDPHLIATGMPTWLTKMDIPMLFESLYRMVTWLYLATRDSNGNGNFIILHLLTSLWGLENVLSAADDNPSKSDSLTRMAVAQWFANFVVLIATTGNGFPRADQLIKMRTEDFEEAKLDPVDFDWTPIVQRGLAEEEEHNIKLVYVTKQLWNRTARWSGFSEAAKSFVLTPDIGPDVPKYDA